MIIDTCFCGKKLIHNYSKYSNLDIFQCEIRKKTDCDINPHCTFGFSNDKLNPYGKYTFQYGDNDITFMFFDNRINIEIDSHIIHTTSIEIKDFSYDGLVKLIDNLEQNKMFL